jgi:hypothetical protein
MSNKNNKIKFNETMQYYDKYLKYKQKYLVTKKQMQIKFGSANSSENLENSGNNEITKVINEFIYMSYVANLSFRHLSEQEIEKFVSIEHVHAELERLYKFNSDTDKTEIVNKMKNDNSYITSFFHSKDLYDVSVRFNTLRKLVAYTIGNITKVHTREEKIKYILFFVEYMIGYQIWSDANHRTAIKIASNLMEKYIDKNIADKFLEWYRLNTHKFNDNDHFGRLSTYNSDANGYNFLLSFDHLLNYEKNNFSIMATQFLSYV